MKIFATTILILIFTSSANAAGAEVDDPALLSFAVGGYDFHRRREEGTEFRLEFGEFGIELVILGRPSVPMLVEQDVVLGIMNEGSGHSFGHEISLQEDGRRPCDTNPS